MREFEDLGQDLSGPLDRELDPSTRPESDTLAVGAIPGGPNPLTNPATVLSMQRLAGNSAVVKWLSRANAEGATDEEEAGSPETSPVLSVVGQGGGRPLDDHVRPEMEQALGADFGDVRIHDDPKASASAEAVSARAYTVGNDVVFQSGLYQPGTADGQRMIAHELTHVVQQRQGPVDGTPAGGGVAISHPSDRFEQAAEESADKVVQGLHVQRQEDDGEEELEEAPVQGAFAQRQEDDGEEELEEAPVQGLFAQRQEDDGEEEALDEAPVQGAFVQRQEDEGEEEELEEAPVQGLFVQRQEDDGGEEELEEPEEPVQGLFVQKDDDDDTASASGTGTDTGASAGNQTSSADSSATGGQQASGDDGGMTSDMFSGMFDENSLASEIATLDDSNLGEADLAPGSPQSTPDQDGTATAQAISVQALTIQRDPPPPSTGPPPSGPTPQQPGAPDAAPPAKQGSPGDVLKAVSQLPQVQMCLKDVKQQAVVQWDKLKADPVALTSTATISLMIAAGVVGGVASSPGPRNTAVNFAFGKDIPLPVPSSVGGTQLPGLSFKVLGANGQANGLVFTLDFAQVLGWQKSTPSGADTAGGSSSPSGSQ